MTDAETRQFRRDLLAVLGRIATALEEGNTKPAAPAAFKVQAFTPVPGVPTYHCDECDTDIPSGSSMQRFREHKPGCRNSAMHLPAARDYRCSAGCGHYISAHGSAGCAAFNCDCTSPHGRIMPMAGPWVNDADLDRWLSDANTDISETLSQVMDTEAGLRQIKEKAADEQAASEQSDRGPDGGHE